MLVHEFPDINWVRGLRNDAMSPANKWKNIALNIKCKQVCRTGVESPYSLFMNRAGHSLCSVNKRQYRVETDCFLLTRPGEQYDLVIDNLQQTEIFNIHINKDFFDGWVHALTTPDERLLDNPNVHKDTDPVLFTQLYRKDDAFNALIGRIAQLDKQDHVGFEYVLGQLIQHLLLSGKEIQGKIAQLPAAKPSVQADIYNRLSIAKDYIQSNYSTALNLDELSKETAISKFHFLRLFKSLYGVSPYQYLTHVRMEKAAYLLQATRYPISEISVAVGFEYPNSFIKSFQKVHGVPPLQYRKVGRIPDYLYLVGLATTFSEFYFRSSLHFDHICHLCRCGASNRLFYCVL
jgi:AraC family transcriptional regulator